MAVLGVFLVRFLLFISRSICPYIFSETLNYVRYALKVQGFVDCGSFGIVQPVCGPKLSQTF